jgi:hypothetical protein
MRNCILWGNASPAGPEIALKGIYPADMTVSYCDVQGGEQGVFVQAGFTLYWGDGNIDADPLFVDQVDGDHRLRSGSPAIDAGHNWAVAGIADTDLDEKPRFVADLNDFDPGCGIPAVVDMGAYEFQIGDPYPVKFGDLDGVGGVGITDFLVLLAAWGPCDPGCCLADLDLDGTVGITDFLALLEAWEPYPRRQCRLDKRNSLSQARLRALARKKASCEDLGAYTNPRRRLAHG